MNPPMKSDESHRPRTRHPKATTPQASPMQNACLVSSRPYELGAERTGLASKPTPAHPHTRPSASQIGKTSPMQDRPNILSTSQQSRAINSVVLSMGLSWPVGCGRVVHSVPSVRPCAALCMNSVLSLPDTKPQLTQLPTDPGAFSGQSIASESFPWDESSPTNHPATMRTEKVHGRRHRSHQTLRVRSAETCRPGSDIGSNSF
jgi:hypothetical protein